MFNAFVSAPATQNAIYLVVRFAMHLSLSAYDSSSMGIEAANLVCQVLLKAWPLSRDILSTWKKAAAELDLHYHQRCVLRTSKIAKHDG